MQNSTPTPPTLDELLEAIRGLEPLLETVGRRLGDLATELDRSNR